MEKKPGYRTITYRFRLYCEPMVLLVETKKRYNQVLAFYYEVLRKEPELLKTTKLKLMRQLEVLTVGTKEQLEEDVKYPIPYEKVPLYFRRAAINDAIRLHLSFCSGEEQGAQMAEKFNASPIFYKGMYKEFTAESIRLKLYDGVAWKWVPCSIDTCGRNLPKEEQMLSPVIVLERGRAMLHVPVKEDVEDVRTVKERMIDTEKLCAVYFPKDDVLAVAVLLAKDGTFLESRFIRGGSRLMHKKQQLYQQIKINRERMLALIDKLGIVPEHIDLGGGLFGKMADSLKAQFDSEIPTYKQYAEAVAPVFAEHFKNVENKPMLLIEPGSALVGDCMHFAAKVVNIKDVRGKAIATLLGSIYNINPTLNKKNPPVEVYSMGGEQKEYTDLDFGGFTCIESDYLYRHYDGKLAKGDMVVFGNVGS